MSRIDAFYSRHLSWIVAGPPLVLVVAVAAKILFEYDGLCRGTEVTRPCSLLEYLSFHYSPLEAGNLVGYGYIGFLIAAWLAVWIPVLIMRRRP